MSMDQNNKQASPTRRQMLTSLSLAGATALAGMTLGTGISGEAHAAVASGKIVLISLGELRKLQKPLADTVYWVTDAGREGFFRLRANDKKSADNDGTLIVGRDGVRFGRLYEGPLNVQWFGARGDGKTDDTAALRKALSTAAETGEVAYIPRTSTTYSISSTVRVPLVAGQQLIVESNGATIKPTANIKSDSLWRLSMFDERIFLSFGIAGSGKQLSKDVHTAFKNNGGTNVAVRGLIIDGRDAVPIVLSTIKGGKPDWDTQVGVGIQISAENVTIENCRFQDIHGYGTRIHGPKNAYIANNTYHEVGGRGNVAIRKLGPDMDGYGDSLYLSSIAGGGQIVVTDCSFQGLSNLPFRSRIGVTFEYGDELYNSIVSNCTFSGYAKCIHIEEKVPSDIKIENCLFRNFNFGIANVINDKGRCVVNNSKFMVTDTDKYDYGSPLFLLNYQSNCASYFSKCEIHLNTAGQTWQLIAGAQLFEGCTFYGYGKNHFFADASARFSNCFFYDFGGPARSFYSGGKHEYVLENCDFTGGDVHAKGQKLKLTFINCRHLTPGKQLLGNYMPNLAGIFPNLGNECSEHVLDEKTTIVSEANCPSPLWNSVGKILVLVLEKETPLARGAKYKKAFLNCDVDGKWNSGQDFPAVKGRRIVLAPAHYANYLE